MEKEAFTYTYSAAQQEEIRRIREKYVIPSQAEDKMEQLRKLDKNVTIPGTIVALIVGVISTLIMGLGMCCTMVWSETLFFPGILVGVLGIIGVCAAYPLYVHITKKQRNKLAPEIIRLSNELNGRYCDERETVSNFPH